MAHNIGVKVAVGTDSRYAAVVDRVVSHEIRELVDFGFSPLQALQSATIVSAEMLRLETRIGAIEPRYEADLIAVAGNPLDDVSALDRPSFIMTNGRVVRSPNP